MIDKEQMVQKELYPRHDTRNNRWRKNFILDMIEKE